ncbi:MAG: hypothetical protein CMF56_00680 [Leifsonia sp.]|nr:hypothetical protein [Leifsonia sp.]|tara:strand:- start:139960 stop:140625 length:666 start_codon:yes stop_codon:yes gene_type:complete
MRGALILDFDGTLCVGDAPVREYARHAFTNVPDGAARLSRLDDFLAHGAGLDAARDGYQAVAALAREAVVPRAALHEAFQRSRADIASWIGEVRAPEGMRELLAELDHVSRILITNSPAGGLDQVIEGLGLSDVLDQVVTDARKPEGMSAALDRAGVLASGHALASLGDIWENDHAEIQARGGVTFLIDRHRRGDGAPTRRAATAEELYPAIRDWADALSM